MRHWDGGMSSRVKNLFWSKVGGIGGFVDRDSASSMGSVTCGSVTLGWEVS